MFSVLKMNGNGSRLNGWITYGLLVVASTTPDELAKPFYFQIKNFVSLTTEDDASSVDLNDKENGDRDDFGVSLLDSSRFLNEREQTLSLEKTIEFLQQLSSDKKQNLVKMLLKPTIPRIILPWKN